jgi:serine/threonine-protein kinase HipA
MRDSTDSAQVLVVLPNNDELLAGTIAREGAGSIGSTITFRYDGTYLRDPRAYPLSPDMPLTSGPIRPLGERTTLGAIGDATPDAWGRRVIRAASRPRDDVDYLVAVSDLTRQGGLRIRIGDDYVSNRPHPAAEIHELDRVLAAARAVEAGTETDEDLRILVAAGTSAGGARPKATVNHEGGLWIAKFSRDTEFSDPMAWEATALTLAVRTGIETAAHRLHRISESDSILLSRRFDRDGERRIGYLSAHSLIVKNDRDPASYTYLADVMSVESASPTADLAELYRRVALNLLIGNVDDHFRNHGFLREASGWRLAPAFDIEPNREPDRVEATPLTDGASGFDRDIRVLLELHDAYSLSRDSASSIIREVAEMTADWRDVAASYGISTDTFPNRAKAIEGANRGRALSMSYVAPTNTSRPGRTPARQPRRGDLGLPGNRGSFASPTRPDGEVSL